MSLSRTLDDRKDKKEGRKKKLVWTKLGWDYHKGIEDGRKNIA